MHSLDILAVVLVTVLVGVEFSVSAFVNPSAWRLPPESQAIMLGHFAAVLGKSMPIWYAVCLLLLGTEAFLHRASPEFRILVLASFIWAAVIVATLLFLVPLNNRVVQGAAGWQAVHRTWDRRHRVRVFCLLLAAVLLIDAVA